VSKWVWFVTGLVGLDQLTKWVIEQTFAFGQRLNLLPFFDLILIYNTGAAFSFLASGSGWQRWVLIVIAFAAIIFIIWLMRKEASRPLSQLSLALILSGAIGNLIDRIWHGHVIDFLLVYWQNWYYPAFNVADMAISIGAVLLIFDEWRRWRESKTGAQPGEGS
jgi:signal peptidase II